MHVHRRRTTIAFVALFGVFFFATCSEAADATIAAGKNYRLDLTIMGQTMGEDVFVEFQDKTLVIRKPEQPAKYAFQGKIEGERLTAEVQEPGGGPAIKLSGKITTQDVAEGDVQILAPTGMEIAKGTFKLFKK